MDTTRGESGTALARWQCLSTGGFVHPVLIAFFHGKLCVQQALSVHQSSVLRRTSPEGSLGAGASGQAQDDIPPRFSFHTWLQSWAVCGFLVWAGGAQSRRRGCPSPKVAPGAATFEPLPRWPWPRGWVSGPGGARLTSCPGRWLAASSGELLRVTESLRRPLQGNVLAPWQHSDVAIGGEGWGDHLWTILYQRQSLKLRLFQGDLS